LFIDLSQYVGLPILYFQLNEHWYLAGVNDKSLMLMVSAFTSYTIAAMKFGYCDINRAVRRWGNVILDK